FLGKEGSGDLAMARAFAQYIVCEKTGGKERPAKAPQPGAAMLSMFGDAEPAAVTTDTDTPLFPPDSCGICPACQKASALIHPDIHFSFPVISQKSGDKPRSVDFIKQWRLFQSEFPYGNYYEWLQFI